jgi:hypothetical protein
LSLLWQVDKARFQQEYARIDQLFKEQPNIQPNWMFAHELQRSLLQIEP